MSHWELVQIFSDCSLKLKNNNKKMVNLIDYTIGKKDHPDPIREVKPGCGKWVYLVRRRRRGNSVRCGGAWEHHRLPWSFECTKDCSVEIKGNMRFWSVLFGVCTENERLVEEKGVPGGRRRRRRRSWLWERERER